MTSISNNPLPHRPRRGLQAAAIVLLLMGICCLPMLWNAKQRAARDRLERLGVQLAYEVWYPIYHQDFEWLSFRQSPHSADFDRLSPAAVKAGLQELRHLDSICGLTVTGHSFDWEDLAQLDRPGLELLKLKDVALPPGAFAKMRNWNRLTRFFLTESNVGDDVLRDLPALPQLLSLEIEGAVHLQLLRLERFINLDFLSLKSTQLTDEHIKGLSAAVPLQVLSMEGPLTDASLKEAGELPALKTLLLWESRVRWHYKAVDAFPKLQSLHLVSSLIDDEGAKQISSISSLVSVATVRSDLSDACFSHWEQLPNLIELGVSESACTDAGADAFRQRYPQCTVVLQNITTPGAADGDIQDTISDVE